MPEVLDGMPELAQQGDHPRLQRETGVVATDGDLHRLTDSAFAFATTFSTLKPSSRKTISPGAEAP